MNYQASIINKSGEIIVGIVDKEQLNKLMLLLADTEEYSLQKVSLINNSISGEDLLDLLKKEINLKIDICKETERRLKEEKLINNYCMCEFPKMHDNWQTNCDECGHKINYNLDWLKYIINQVRRNKNGYKKY